MSAWPTEPKPCPFCKREDWWVWDKGVPGGVAVCCSNPLCAATGPISMQGLAHAVTLWDTRP